MTEAPTRLLDLDAREGLVRALALLLILALGFLLWPSLAEAFGAAFRGTTNALLKQWTFGNGGRAILMGAEQLGHASSEADASWDTRLMFGVPGVGEPASVRVNPRRAAYLPLVFFGAVVAVAPLQLRRKLRCLLLGAPLVWGVGMASVVMVAAWLFANEGAVYTLGPHARDLLELAYRALVVPLANKFILAALLAASLVAWQHANERRAASAPLPKPGAVLAQASGAVRAKRPQPRAKRRKRPRARPRAT